MALKLNNGDENRLLALTVADNLALFVWEDIRPLHGAAGFLDWLLCGQLSTVLAGGFFSGCHGEDLLLLPRAGKVSLGRVFAFGLGEIASSSRDSLVSDLGHADQVLRAAGVDSAIFAAPALWSQPERERDFIAACNTHFGDRRIELLRSGM